MGTLYASLPHFDSLIDTLVVNIFIAMPNGATVPDAGHIHISNRKFYKCGVGALNALSKLNTPLALVLRL